MPTPLSHRFRRVLPVSVAVVAVLGGASCSSSTKSDAADYCATMPDSVGLYVGNPITHLGYPIGEVSSITPSAQSVRVDFTIDDGQTIPADAKAVTRSTSILADRALELVGDYEKSDHLSPGSCIPLSRSLTPKTLSEVIGASTDFVNSINPAGSNNVGDLVKGIDEAARSQGANVNTLLTTTSSVFDSPDQAIGDMASITRNLGQLTGTLNDLNPTTQQVFDDLASSVGTELRETFHGSDDAFEGIVNVIADAQGIEKELGPQVQQLLDAIAVVVRKATPRAPFYASLLNVAPRVINGLINLANNHDFTLHYRPPTYRLRAPDGVLQCNIMNASMPGSCANVKGTPYAVDVALLQYVLTQAANK
jgi:phospholipid/cholesterol/gamma-HCH transport system substrate-binding protein